MAERLHRHDEIRVLETSGMASDLARQQHPAGHRPTPRRRRVLREIFAERRDCCRRRRRRGSERRRRRERRSMPLYGAAEFDGGGNQRIEHRLQIERRAADDLQHVGGRGLLLQRLREIARARLHLVEQPHVLDRDHGLVGEGLDEFDLPSRERPGARRATERRRRSTSRLRAAAARRAGRGSRLSSDLPTARKSGSSRTSGMCAIGPVRIARPATEPRTRGSG